MSDILEYHIDYLFDLSIPIYFLSIKPCYQLLVLVQDDTCVVNFESNFENLSKIYNVHIVLGSGKNCIRLARPYCIFTNQRWVTKFSVNADPFCRVVVREIP